MSKGKFWEYAIFFDDGGVMNDNRLRGIQWQKMIGEYFSPKYGGEPYKWAEGIFEFIKEVLAEQDEDLPEYDLYYDTFKTRWIASLFKYVGIEVPPKKFHSKIYDEAIDFITPNVKAAFPGVIDTIKKLHSQGFMLFTASAENSFQLKGYLRGMRVLEYFEKFYGPDLINTHKFEESYYTRIFENLSLDPRKAIIIEDNPRYLNQAEKAGANVIQACLTGEYKPCYKYYFKQIVDLNEVILKMLKK